MPRIQLMGGAYTARGVIANAQRCLNLYPEINPKKNSPTALTHYPTPGLTRLVTAPNAEVVRGVYRASDGQLFAVVGAKVYFVASNWSMTEIGSIAAGTNPTSMADNGFDLVLVDGTQAGYVISLSSHAFSVISDPSFYGSVSVKYLDTYFLFNRPGTNQWYISLALSTGFDALDIAAKVGYPDPIQNIAVMHREVWLIGTLTTEIWYNAGSPDFTFAQLPGAFIEHGTCAPYSVAYQDLSVYWLSQDMQGQRMVVEGSGYQAKRISTHAIEYEIAKYAVVEDAIGYTYQQEGHVFYVLNFPTANKTWVYDRNSELWHERAYLDSDGNLIRHRSNCCAFAYGKNVVGDFENGKLYAFDLNSYTDDRRPISRIRSFPHLMQDDVRVFYKSFIADIEVGTDTEDRGLNTFLTDEDGNYILTEDGDYIRVGDIPPVDPLDPYLVDENGQYILTEDGQKIIVGAEIVPPLPPQIFLRYSDTRGSSWGNAIGASMGLAGEYLTSVQYQRLGMARDRVFELSWSVPARTCLNGAFITTGRAAT